VPVANGFANVRQNAVHEQCSNRPGSFAVHARQGMLVDAGGEAFRVVPEPSTDNLEVDTSLESGGSDSPCRMCGSPQR
jgi:hypothetical protein